MSLNGAEIGAKLGTRLVQVASKAREVSLAKTTPGLTQQAVAIAEQVATTKARAAADALEGWLMEWAGYHGPPGEVSALLGALKRVGGFLAQNVFGTAIGFGVGGALTSVLDPYFSGMAQAAWRSNPIQVLSPAELALAVLRGNLDHGPAAAEAEASGMSGDRFDTMVLNTGEPPGLEGMLSLWRRDMIDDAALERAIRQSRVRNEWIEDVKKLAVIPMSAEEALEALLEGQTDRATAERLYKEGGGNPDQFELRFHTRGTAPSPVQAGDAANRGLIPWAGRGPDVTSFEQGFLEGPWRNKWSPIMAELAQYLPPPRTITTLLSHGAITKARAVELWMKNGLAPEDAQAYAESAVTEKQAGDRALTTSEVTSLYEGGLIERGEAAGILGALGYDAHDTELKLSLSDARWERRFTETALGTLHTRFVAHRIPEQVVQTSMDHLGVPPSRKADLIELWNLERDTVTQRLTASQVQQAFRAGLFTHDEATTELAGMGYDRSDVGILLALAAPAEAGPQPPHLLTYSQVLKAWKNGVITEADARQRLSALGYSDTDVGIIIEANRPEGSA